MKFHAFAQVMMNVCGKMSAADVDEVMPPGDDLEVIDDLAEKLLRR